MPGFFDVDERLADLSAKGDDLERVKALVDFEIFRPALEAAVPRANRSKGGRPPFDHVFMFKVLILQAMDSLSDERCEYLIKDSLSFMRFLGLGLSDAVPDANTIWTFRETLKKANAVDGLFQRFDAALRDAGSLAMSGQIVDATIVAAPKQRNTDDEKGDQGRARSRGLEGEAGQTRAKGPRCAPAGRPRRSRLRLQEPCLDRLCVWADPQMDGDAASRLRRRSYPLASRIRVPQLFVQNAIRDQLFDMSKTLIAVPLELLQGQIGCAVGVI
jgi:transposase